MAPQQPVDFFDEEEWDNEDMIVPSAAHIFSNKESVDKDCELGGLKDSTTIMTPSKPKPKSILRRRRLADDSSTQQQGEQSSSSSVPSHWPTASAATLSTKHFRRRRVHFADGLQRRLSSSPPSVVTAIYFRERTPLSDISSLYYSALDIKNFKREFRALLRAQRLTRERMGQNSEERITMTSPPAAGGDVKKDTSSSCSDGPSRCNNTTTFESSRQGGSGGFFSSVFDVVFGTSNSSSSYYQKDKPTFHHYHLVDTLYIF
jgi:hypothetical protein